MTLCLAFVGCGEDDPVNVALDRTPTPTVALPSCGFHAGALPEETLPAGTPHGAAIPIEHIIVLMQENHSFDNYFGQLPAAGHADVDGLPANASNPDATGTPATVFHQTRYCTEDTNHAWTGSHLEFDAGKNDGFVMQNEPGGARTMGYYDASDLPFYYALAKAFAIGDRYFCSVLGPTFPNRFYLLAGTSFGQIRNQLKVFSQRTIFDEFDAQNIAWKVYRHDFAYASLFRVNKKNLAPIAAFFSDAAAGLLPPVAFIDGSIGIATVENDEHPPANVQRGQQFAATVIEALLASPNWATSALFLTYDEHGGFYDHVPPPPACLPDNIAPMLDPSDPDSSFAAQFDRYGFRVPFMVVSPYAKPGFVSHTVYDHTSILRFIEARFDLPALTGRDANALPLLDLFDFSHPALLHPPALPDATIDAAGLQQCRTDFPGLPF